jgi:adenylate cyclase
MTAMTLSNAQIAEFANDLALCWRQLEVYKQLVPTPIGRSDSQPRNETRYITTLFTDLRGFTAIAERLKARPAELLNVVNTHLETVVRTVQHHGGVVEKFSGDGLMATFGARSPSGRTELAAVCCGFGIVAANEQLNREFSERWGFRLEVGVGAAAGRAIIGRLGSLNRWEMGVLGDCVNIAARLVGRARPGELVLDSSVYEPLRLSVRGEMTSWSGVRGRVGTLDIYRIPCLPSA